MSQRCSVTTSFGYIVYESIRDATTSLTPMECHLCLHGEPQITSGNVAIWYWRSMSLLLVHLNTHISVITCGYDVGRVTESPCLRKETNGHNQRIRVASAFTRDLAGPAKEFIGYGRLVL